MTEKELFEARVKRTCLNNDELAKAISTNNPLYLIGDYVKDESGKEVKIVGLAKPFTEYHDERQYMTLIDEKTYQTQYNDERKLTFVRHGAKFATDDLVEIIPSTGIKARITGFQFNAGEYLYSLYYHAEEGIRKTVQVLEKDLKKAE